MAETLLSLLILCILWAVSLAILYWIVKKAVKNGILEAHQEMEHPSQKVKYPIKIDENNPDLPFRDED